MNPPRTPRPRQYRRAAEQRRRHQHQELTAQAARTTTRRRRRRLLRVGQLLMAVGVVVAVIHWFAHLGAFGAQPSALVDVLAGYPAGGVLFVAGAILAGQ